MSGYQQVYAAIDRLVPFGPDAAPNAARLCRMLDGMHDSAREWSLIAALTTHTPAGLVAYNVAIGALLEVGVTRGNDAWYSPWRMW